MGSFHTPKKNKRSELAEVREKLQTKIDDAKEESLKVFAFIIVPSRLFNKDDQSPGSFFSREFDYIIFFLKIVGLLEKVETAIGKSKKDVLAKVSKETKSRRSNIKEIVRTRKPET